MRCSRFVSLFAIACALPLASLSVAPSAMAFPFNEDMVARQPVTGSFMRPRPQDSVGMGSLESRVATREDAMKLTNPVKGDKLSAENGERLFYANCSICHGRWMDGKHMPSSLPATMPSINLTDQRYRDMTDGAIYGTIHFGSLSTLMPPYGWKLSPQEHWDLINYIRKVQSETAK